MNANPINILEKTSLHTDDPLLFDIVNLLYNKKAQDIVVIDLRKKSAFASHMVVASGLSTRQVYALSKYVERHLKNVGISAYTEGQENAQWVLIFAQDIAIHLFTPETRGTYAMESLWAHADNTIRIPNEIAG